MAQYPWAPEAEYQMPLLSDDAPATAPSICHSFSLSALVPSTIPFPLYCPFPVLRVEGAVEVSGLRGVPSTNMQHVATTSGGLAQKGLGYK